MKNLDMPKDVPRSIVDAVDAVARAGQKYGEAVGKDRPLATCEELMKQQQEATQSVLRLVSSELSRRYEGGLELGRQQQAGKKALT